MTYEFQLVEKIIENALSQNILRVKAYSKLLISELEESNPSQAERLEKILSATPRIALCGE